MKTFETRNVNTLYPKICDLFEERGVWEESAKGKVLVLPHPMMTCIRNPWERVLFSRVRDANPFFHVAESVWMLAGQRNAKFLDQFVKDFSVKYGESAYDDEHTYIEEGDIHGAYGYRWRYRWDDQLRETINRLQKNPYDRQVVISMWDPGTDYCLYSNRNKNDYPCNTHMYVRIRNGEFLDLTVCCRSNDAIWGAMGANVFHFSFLQEWLAAALNVKIGYLYQMSNNYHVYEKIWQKRKDYDVDNPYYSITGICSYPLAEGCFADFTDDCESVFREDYPKFVTPWFQEVYRPMMEAHRLYKEGAHAYAMRMSQDIQAKDLRLAAKQWLLKRIQK